MIPQRPAFFPEDGGVRPDPRFIPSAGGAQWRGTRQEQNDVLFISDYDPMKGLLVALADGIGLEADAGRAAEAAVNAIRQDFIREEPMEDPRRQTLRMAGAAHAAIRALNEANQERNLPPVGAAAACALVRNRRLAFSAVGNVRVFLIRAGALLQLSRDHLLSLEAEERDILSGEAPDIDPEWAKRVTAFAGMESLQKIDTQQTPVFLIPGDRVLIMSSGLYGVLTEEELCSLACGGPPGQAAEAIISRVREMHQASQSNISVALIRFGQI